jgi:virginiamycin B lyase
MAILRAVSVAAASMQTLCERPAAHRLIHQGIKVGGGSAEDHMGGVSRSYVYRWPLRSFLMLAIVLLALLLSALLAPSADAFIYWTRENLTEDCIGRANNDGSIADPYFITGCSGASGVTVGGGYIYWANLKGGTIGRAKIDGSEANQSFITGCRSPDLIDVGVSHVYWTNWDPYGQPSIARARVDGTEVDQDVISTRATGLAVYDNHIYWTYYVPNVMSKMWLAWADTDGSDQEKLFEEEGNSLGPIWVGSPYFYFAWGGSIGRGETPSGLLWSLDLDRDHISGQPDLGRPFDAYDHYIYWITGPAGDVNYIGKIKTDGTNADPQLFPAGVWVADVAVDGGSVGTDIHHLFLGVQEHSLLPSGLRASLKAKLLAAKAAYDRSAYKSTLNALHATANEIEAQSGKGIPAETAERWLLVIGKLEKMVL